MNINDVVAAILFLAVIIYAILGGADFGGGVWDLIAGNARRGAATRRLIDHAIGPVWEANHVWLIFILVFLWTGFPVAFAAMMRSLAVPFWLVGLGIVLRGAGFAFRKLAPTLRWAQVAGVVFAASSLITPFFLGAIAGAIASGRVDQADPDAGLTTWISATSVLGGVLAVLTCTFLAGVFLASEANRIGDDELCDSLRRRSIVVGAITGAVALAGVLPIERDAKTLSHGLTGRASGLVVISAVAGATALVLLSKRRLRWARVAAVGAVGSIVAGWGVAQYPWVLVDHLEIDQAAGDSATLTGLVIAAGLAGVLVVPALVYLFTLADSNQVGSE